MRLLLLITLCVCNSFAFGQKTDIIITTKGDTITGKVTFNLANKQSQMVSIKTVDGKKNLKVYEVKSVVKKKETYGVIKIDNVYQFAKHIKTGYLSLYSYVNYESSSAIFNATILIKNAGESMLVPNLTFRKTMSDYLSDCPEVVNNFENKIYKKSDMHKIIDDYNQCITKNTNASLNTSKRLNYVNKLIEEVNLTSELKDKAELLEMLNEIKIKVQANESVPSFIIKALKTSLEANDELLKLVDLTIQ